MSVELFSSSSFLFFFFRLSRRAKQVCITSNKEKPKQKSCYSQRPVTFTDAFKEVFMDRYIYIYIYVTFYSGLWVCFYLCCVELSTCPFYYGIQVTQKTNFHFMHLLWINFFVFVCTCTVWEQLAKILQDCQL